MLIDLDRCTRCDECVKACVDSHQDGRSRLFLTGPRAHIGERTFLVPTTCQSCEDPVCMIGCPTRAIRRGDKGEMNMNLKSYSVLLYVKLDYNRMRVNFRRRWRFPLTEERTARLTILIDPRKKAVFERLCAQEDVTPSQVVRQLIRRYISERLGRPWTPEDPDSAGAMERKQVKRRR